MDIRCRRTSCTHNKGHTCFALGVDISDHAVCKTFERRENVDIDDLDFSKSMFETAPEYENSRHIKNVSIKCNATRCLFNNCGKCRANGITVVDDDEKSRCGSFINEL